MASPASPTHPVACTLRTATIPFGETDFIEVEPRPVGFFCRLLRRPTSLGGNVVIAEYPAELFAEIVHIASAAQAQWAGRTLKFN